MYEITIIRLPTFQFIDELKKTLMLLSLSKPVLQWLTSTCNIWSYLLLPHRWKTIITVVDGNLASFIFILVDSSANTMNTGMDLGIACLGSSAGFLLTMR